MPEDRSAGERREGPSESERQEGADDGECQEGPSDEADRGAPSDEAHSGDPSTAWRELFGFDEPYESQADAVERALAVGQRGGYLAMEGPCGTGKTMAALTAGAALVRHTRKYERVVVVTPVKQQRLQFVEDLRTMNARLAADEDAPDPLDGVALVGKRDLCPYGREGVFPDDASTHDRCEDLRDATADLVEGDRRSGDEPIAEAAIAADPEMTAWLREISASGQGEHYRTTGDLPADLMVADETVMLLLSDEAGTRPAVVETDSSAVREWAIETVEAHRRDATLVDADDLAD